MKKFLLLLLTISICVACGNEQNTKHVEIENSLKRRSINNLPIYGDIKVATVEEYKLNDRFGEELVGEWLETLTIHYNTEGQIVKIIKKGIEPRRNYTRVYSYDSAGNCTSESHYNDMGILSSKKIKIYDSNGKVIEESQYGRDENLQIKIKNKYDDQGNLIERREYGPDNDLTYRRTYAYDYNGNQINEKLYESNDKIRYEIKKSTQYHYTEYFDSNGKITAWESTSFDSMGNQTEFICYDSIDMIFTQKRYTYTYDSNGNMTEKVYYDTNDNIVYKYKYTYDSRGNDIQETRIDSEGNETMESINKYDSENNLIERVNPFGKSIITYDSRNNPKEEKFYSGETVSPYSVSYYTFEYR